MYTTKSLANPILTETISEGEGIRELWIDALTAISTPPPREDLSLRYKTKSLGRISRSDSHVSLKQKMLKSDAYTNDCNLLTKLCTLKAQIEGQVAGSHD